MSSAPRERAGSAAPGPSAPRGERGARRRRNWTWRRRAPQLSAGTPGPAPATPPPRPRRSPFLPPLLRGPGRGAPWAPGRCDPGLSTGCASVPRPLPVPGRPYLPPSRARAARGGRKGGGRRREEAKRSEERTVPGEEPAPAAAVSTPSFPPRKRGDGGGGGHERKSRFPGAAWRSGAARHEPEETAAAARRPLGQEAPRALELGSRLAPPPRADAPGGGGGPPGAQSQRAARQARPAPASLGPDSRKTSRGFGDEGGGPAGIEASSRVLARLQQPAFPSARASFPRSRPLPGSSVLEHPDQSALEGPV